MIFDPTNGVLLSIFQFSDIRKLEKFSNKLAKNVRFTVEKEEFPDLFLMKNDKICWKRNSVPLVFLFCCYTIFFIQGTCYTAGIIL